MKRKSINLLYAFLEQKGVLHTEDSDLIQRAKDEYWKNYRREWRKNKRHQNKSYTILLNYDEAKQVINEAKKYHASPTQYIKGTALAGKQIADPVAIGKLRELLYAHYNSLQAYIDKKILPESLGHKMMEDVAEIEKKTFAILAPRKL
ncbi:hypothetical protein [Ferruginibacter sp.]